MDHTNRSNLALQGRYYFLVREGQDCKMRWSQNTNKRRREIVRLKVGDFAQLGTSKSALLLNLIFLQIKVKIE